MPELPEVETTRLGLTPHLINKRVERVTLRQDRLRWTVSPELAERVQGQVLQTIQRRGKYLLFGFASGTALWHLGMSGSLRIAKAHEQPGAHDHIDWLFHDGTLLRYHDPRRFGALLWTEEPADRHALIQHLGPEPLLEGFDGDYLYHKSRQRKAPVKTWLMDATMVVGVGNIYANEALFMSGIRPTKAAGKLTQKQCNSLAENVKQVLRSAIERGGTTLRDFVGGDGKPGYFAQELRVYGRGGQACKLCSKALTEERLGGRSTVYCRNCQK